MNDIIMLGIAILLCVCSQLCICGLYMRQLIRYRNMLKRIERLERKITDVNKWQIKS